MDFCETDMVAHHVRMGGYGGMGMKPSDYRTLPLTAFQHVKLHSTVEKDYYEVHELDAETIMRDLMFKYIRTKLNMPIGDDLEFHMLEDFIDLHR
jgi:hypothetical protein